MQISAVIVDDEQASRDTLSSYLTKYCPDVEVLAISDSVKSGVEAIRANTPDLVFLDVEMPYGNAFDLLEQVDDLSFETIFVTAFSNYAIKALNVSASYYILKPIDIDDLVAAVEKVKAVKAQENSSLHTKVLIENIQTLNKQHQKVVLPLIDGFEVVPVKDVIRCKANDNFTEFFLLDGRKLMICRTLKFYEDILTEYGFMRVHKSHMVNLQQVKRYKRGKGGQLIMSDESEVEVSPNRKKDLLDQF
ncbi:MAG: LytTR family DNA-binding domain-containing protein [Bacteroidota bacterium]